MIGLLSDSGSGYFSGLWSAESNSGPGLSGPIGLSSSGGGDSVGLSGGVGLDFNAGDGLSVGLNGGIGLFA